MLQTCPGKQSEVKGMSIKQGDKEEKASEILMTMKHYGFVSDKLCLE